MKRYFCFSLLFFFISHFTLFSQDKGEIRGRVFNSKNNEPVSFSVIANSGSTAGVSSGIDGAYVLSGLKPGYLQLKVTCVGYKPYISEPVLVTNADPVFIDIPLEESNIDLKEVNVSASPFTKRAESPVSLRRITIDEIEKNPGSNRDISKVIQAFPGVSSTPNNRNDVIVRGGGASENRFYLDGVEIPNLNHFATQGTSGGSVGIINIDFVKEVNFYSGAFPSMYGNALSSILDFKQKDGNKDHLKTRTTVGASDLALTLDGPLGKNTTFISSYRRSYLQFLFAALELPFLPIYNDFQFKTKTKWNDKTDLTFIGLGAYDISELNTSANKTESQRYILGYLPTYKQWNYTFGGVLKHYRENGTDTWVLSRNFLNNVSYKYQNNIKVDSLKTYDYSSWESEDKIRYEHLSNVNGFRYSYGLNMEYAKYYNRTFRKMYNTTPVIYKSTLDFIKYGLFAQVSKYFYDDRLSLSLGLRSDASTYSVPMGNLLKQFSPRFSILYRLSEQWNVSGNIGRYYQLPAYTTLGFRNNAGELINKKNGVAYINSDHVVLGFQYLPNAKTSLSVETFYKWYRNYPFSVSDSVSISSKGADFVTYGDEEVRSLSKGRAYGAEILFQSKSLDGFNFILSYTLVRSEATDYKNSYISTSWDNKHILNVTGLRSLKHNWDIGFKWRFVGGAPYTPYDMNRSSLVSAWDAMGKAYPDYSMYNQARLKSFHQLDVRVDKAYYFNKWSLMLYLDIQNIYDFKADSQSNIVRETDANGNYLPASGDPARYPLKTLASSGGGTILPSIGLTAQF